MENVYAPQSGTDARQFVKSFQSDGTANFDQVGFEELDFSAIFGTRTSSTTTNAIAYGIKGFTLDTDDGSIQVGYPLQCTSLDDQDCFMQGVVTLKDFRYSPAYIEVAITILSPLVNTTNNWELQVVPVSGFSVQPSATAGISTSSVDASGAGPFTFVTQTDKLFMQTAALGGTVVCASLSDPSVYLFGRVQANASNSLVVNKIYSNATVAHNAWSIQMFDGPDNGLLMADCIGLAITSDSLQTLTITSGSCRDSTNTVDLVLSETLEKDISLTFTEGDGGGSQIVTGNLAGTISISGTAVTGVGTSFVTDLPKIPDPASSAGCVITFSGTKRTVTSVANNTSATLFNSSSASAETFTRGGYTSESAAFPGYFVVIGRRDDNGVCDIFTAQSNSAYDPDLPAGYTFYRKLAFISLFGGDISTLRALIASPSSAVPYLRAANAAFPNAVLLTGSTSVALTNGGFGSITYSPKRAALTGDVTASLDSNTTTIAANASLTQRCRMFLRHLGCWAAAPLRAPAIRKK